MDPAGARSTHGYVTSDVRRRDKEGGTSRTLSIRRYEFGVRDFVRRLPRRCAPRTPPGQHINCFERAKQRTGDGRFSLRDGGHMRAHHMAHGIIGLRLG